VDTVGGRHQEAELTRPGQDGQRRGERRGRRRDDDGSRERAMVPPAEFTSYYGRPVLKRPVWKDDIAYYLFFGGLSAGSSMLGAGAAASGRPTLRRGTRVAAVASLGAGMYYLIKDLGRPERFHHMLRVAKPTSPMSMGTWLLTGYGPAAGVAAAAELMPGRLRRTRLGRLIGGLADPAGATAATLAPMVASYTAVLISQTAVPVWHGGRRELPFVFTGSAAASAGGLGMILAPTAEAGPARRFAAYGAAVELAASHQLERRLAPDRLDEPLSTGDAGATLRRARALTAAGAVGTVLFGRSRLGAAAAGAALLAGSWFTRLGLLHAGIESTVDPKYVVGPQRRRLEDTVEKGAPARAE
jgi:Polysulphide reductase, NrfD